MKALFPTAMVACFVLGGMTVQDPPAPPRADGVRCLRDCRACEVASKGQAAHEACWSASSTCCEARGKRPVFHGCGCW